MSRPLRVLVAGGWYHVMNRGSRRAAIFVDDDDRRRFLGLLSELPERFKLELHAYVLMENHYHLLLRTLEANLSDAIRWLHVTYSSRFNWAHRKVGHVFQGRYQSQILQHEKSVIEVARYLHLNPVRIGGLGLGKAEQRQAKVLGSPDPGGELVRGRLERLRDFRWSSWRVYAGTESPPAWLSTRVIGSGVGGRTPAEQRAALRKYTETPIRQGHLGNPWEHLVGRVALGDADWAKQLIEGQKVSAEEQPDVRALRRLDRPAWSQWVAWSEAARGLTWREMLEKHGDWGRDGTLYVAVRFAGFRLGELLPEIPGLRSPAASQGIKRFALALEKDAERRQFVSQLRRHLSKIET